MVKKITAFEALVKTYAGTDGNELIGFKRRRLSRPSGSGLRFVSNLSMRYSS